MKKMLCLLSVLFFLAACDDSGTSADNASKEKAVASDLRVESMSMLPNCTATHEGEVALVTDFYNTYKCENGEWTMLMKSTVQTLDDLSNCAVDFYETTGPRVLVNVESEGGIYICKEKKWTKVDDIPNLSIMKDARDGQTYMAVTIGSQTWMAQNLNYETDSSFCYNDMENNCAKYGRLYTWSAAMSACPSGWHLPDTTEWKTLSNAVGGDSAAGHVLMSIYGWPNGNGTDAFGFSALPAGVWSPAFPFWDEEARYAGEGEGTNFWSSTESDYWPGEDDNDGVCAIFLTGSQKDFARWGLVENGKEDAYRRSVRCVKD